MTFQPNKQSYGQGAGRYVLVKAVNRDDPEQSGRVQCRVFGWQEDKGLIPDEDLIWCRPMMSTNNPMSGGIGKSPHGGAITKEGQETWFRAEYSDGDQHLMLSHVVHKGGEENDKGAFEQDGRKADGPPHGRDASHGGKDARFDGEEFKDESTTEYAKNEAKNPFGQRQAKDASLDTNKSFSLGMVAYG